MITFTLDIIFDNSFYLIYIYVNLTAPVEFSLENSYVAILCSPACLALTSQRRLTSAHAFVYAYNLMQFSMYEPDKLW